MRSHRLAETFFYAMERSIRTYRQLAQARITAAGVDLTIDQWLVLKTLEENPDGMQQEIGELVFKDAASITRIIQLLVTKGLVARSIHRVDGRRRALRLTSAGVAAIRRVEPIVRENRRRALRRLVPGEVTQAQRVLNALYANCLEMEVP